MTTVNLAAIAENTVNRLSGHGKHTTAYAELRDHAHQLEKARALVEADNQQLIADAETREQELHTALIRGCQDAMLIARQREQIAGLAAGIRNTQHDLIRAKAEQERLRRAVINARPRIREVPTDLVRPYSPVVCLPYVSPVPYRDTSNDETQALPILDQPQPWPVYRMPAT